MNEVPIKPSDVMLDSDRILGEKVDTVLRELNSTLKAELQKGGGRNEKIYIILSATVRDLIRASPEVAPAVLAEYKETGEWVIRIASEYQLEFYVADSPAGRQVAETMRRARSIYA